MIQVFLIIPILLLNYNLDNIINIYNNLSNTYSEKTLFVYGSSILQIGFFWSYSSMFHIFDSIQYFNKYRVQSQYSSISRSFNSIIKLVLFNQLITPFIAYLLYNFYSYPPIPDIYTIIIDIIKFIFIIEILFYYSHRLLHIPYLYKKIHSIHHKYTAPNAIISLYTHPIEYIISNILPVMIGPLLCNSHIITIWIWILISLFNAMTVHSGYNLFFISDTKHDMHHILFKYNFGVLNVLDYLHGTLK